jgi:hypothetical protein
MARWVYKAPGDRYSTTRSHYLGKDEEAPNLTPIEPSLETVATVEGLRDFFTAEQKASKARGDKMPTPLISQVLTRSHIRRSYGHIAVGAILRQTARALPGAGYPETHEDAIRAGTQTLARLAGLRSGVDGQIAATAYTEAQDQAAPLRDPAAQVGRRILELLPSSGFPNMSGLVCDAVLALELTALDTHQVARLAATTEAAQLADHEMTIVVPGTIGTAAA